MYITSTYFLYKLPKTSNERTLMTGTDVGFMKKKKINEQVT